MMESDTVVRISKFMLKFEIISFADWPITNPFFMKPEFIVDCVPDENIGRCLEELCIGRSNLKHFDGKIVDSNLKKIGPPNPSNL